MTDHRPFAEVLAGIRRRHELSQSEVARRGGLLQSQVSEWENGRPVPGGPPRLPRRSTLVALADALECDDMDRRKLFQSAGFNPDKDENPLVDQLRDALNDPSMSEEDVHRLQSFVRRGLIVVGRA